MRKMSFAKSVFAAGLVVACAWGIVGCSTADESGGAKLTGGVAATVNGVEIAEDDVTTMIETQRASSGLDEEDAWGSYLASAGTTPEEIRENFIDGFIGRELVRQYASELGVTVDEAEVEESFENTRSNFSDDEKWQAALESQGMTEDTYRDNIRFSLLYNGVVEAFAVEEPSDENMLTYAQMFATSYTGAKKSSHILFDASDEETAQQVLDQINAGTLDFAEAAAEYSKDSSGADGGNVGWDKLTTFVTEYQDALDELEVGQVSGLVTSEYGIHIIKCTDEFTAPDELTDPSVLPEEFLEKIRPYAISADEDAALDEWLQGKRDASEIVINDMPEGLPYDVDMSKYETEDEASDEGDGESSDAADDGSASASDASEASGVSDSSAADGATDADADADAGADAGADNAADSANSDEAASSDAGAEGTTGA